MRARSRRLPGEACVCRGRSAAFSSCFALGRCAGGIVGNRSSGLTTFSDALHTDVRVVVLVVLID